MPNLDKNACLTRASNEAAAQLCRRNATHPRQPTLHQRRVHGLLGLRLPHRVLGVHFPAGVGHTCHRHPPTTPPSPNTVDASPLARPQAGLAPARPAAPAPRQLQTTSTSALGLTIGCIAQRKRRNLEGEKPAAGGRQEESRACAPTASSSASRANCFYRRRALVLGGQRCGRPRCLDAKMPRCQDPGSSDMHALAVVGSSS